ncbi:hypothetical protein [Arthrobacter sp. UYEF36]|uniref:hypothetical protein n=1 Tax=Arthrobacter sp. UYEF36 TaxID=1756366 RepID=UPI0033932E19
MAKAKTTRPNSANKTASGSMEVAPGVEISTTYDTTFEDQSGYDIRVLAEITDQFRIEVSELDIKRRPGGPAVTSEGIRSITVQGLVREMIQIQIEEDFYSGGEYASKGFGMLKVEEALRLKKAGPSTETLEWVARIYKVAELLDKPPTIAVEETFEVSRSTAGAWIGRARAAGLVPKPRNANA